MEHRHRQEVLNVLLAQLLQERGLVSAPEVIRRGPSTTTRLPDVIVDLHGLRLVIECEFSAKPLSAARQKALEKAQERVRQAVAHVGVAVLYPASLKSERFEALKERLARSELQYAVVTETGTTDPRPQERLFRHEPVPPSYQDGDVEGLAQTLRRCYEQLVDERTLEEAVQLIRTRIAACVDALEIQPATSVRMGQCLGIPDIDTRPGAKSERRRFAVNRIGALVLVNAMMFQEVLSQSHPKVHPLVWFKERRPFTSEIQHHWKFILDEINYYPVFHMATALLECFSAERSVSEALDGLLDAALRVVSWRALLRHDLAGRIYHRMLEEAKYFGAYYTSVPAAAMLLSLALSSRYYQIDWGDLGDLVRLRIADLACGTGTLLMAAADAISDNYIRACAERGAMPELTELHKRVVTQVLYGYDVLPAAIHLTACTLSLRTPDAPVDVTHLYRLLLGGDDRFLGSLDFIRPQGAVGTIFAQHQQIGGEGVVERGHVQLPDLDLCVMNPPFTRSVGGNLLFGNLPQKERSSLQRTLSSLLKARGLSASITAGLGSVFAALGDDYLKQGGHLAFVIPRALLSGVAWKKTRLLVEKKYHLEWLVVSHEPHHWNFSENTNLSEVLIVARKRENSENTERVNCVNLWLQPRNPVEAIGVSTVLAEREAPDVHEGQGALNLCLGGRKVGEAVAVPWAWLKGRLWSFPCAFAQTDLIRTLVQLLEGRLVLPRQDSSSQSADIPLTRLGSIGELGFDARDIHDGFEYSQSVTVYPAFWGHQAKAVRTIEQTANGFLSPLPKAKNGRPLRRASDLWPKAGRLLIAERLWLNTVALTSVLVRERVLAVQWWPFSPSSQDEDQLKALTVWLNSTPAILLMLGHREETRGAWVKFKKATLKQLPVLDLTALSRPVTSKLAKAFDLLADKPLAPLPQMESDPVRKALDDAVADALGLPRFEILRQLLAREPIVSLNLSRLLNRNSGHSKAR